MADCNSGSLPNSLIPQVGYSPPEPNRPTSRIANFQGRTFEQTSGEPRAYFSKGTIVKESVVTRNGRKGYERIYRYNGKYLILSGIGTNGFIVSAYPTTKEKL